MSLIENVFNGEKINSLVIDAHGHYGTSLMPDFADYIKEMDRVGIDKYCCAPLYQNDKGLEFLQAYPDRVLLYHWYDPYYDMSEEELSKRLDVPGVIGFKIHPNANGVACNSKAFKTVWELANEKKTAVLSHTWYPNMYCDPSMYAGIAKDYPDAKIILGHSGGSVDGFLRSVKLVNKYENIYMELDNTNHHYNQTEYLAKNADISKVLFGSDFPTEDFAPHLGPILAAQVEDTIKEKILGQNMKDLLESINRYR